MEKKNLNSRQGFSKALSSDSRKSSDTNKQQQWPRNARRRENPNLSNSKVDPQRITKQGSAKSRPNVDKRPKPRGNGTGASGGNGNKTSNATDVLNDQQSIDTSAAGGPRLGEDEEFSDDDQCDLEIELNSVYTQGSKKQNLNHLLNFHYISRDNENTNSRKHNFVSERYGGHKYKVKKHQYNKEQFLQANFQFVINADAEQYISASSPDTLVDWSLIEQINIQTIHEPQCPICLYPPIAAKLTRCGHAYCWPCILHYLALSDKTWRKCPICYDAIHINDLKSTVIVQQMNFSVGDNIKLHLMRRERNSMLVEKVDIKKVADNVKIPHISDGIERKRFAKFLLAGYHEILSIIEREKAELMLGLEEDCPEFIFNQQALDLLEERRGFVNEKLEKLVGTSECVEESLKKISSINIEEETSFENENEITDEGNSENTENETVLLEASNSNNSNKVKDFSKYFYFYQSEDGQNVFLHPLNVKMLQAMYGSLSQGPAIIEAKILQKEIQSMDENLRKKFSCLGHLPLTCQFEIVEVQFEAPVVSEAILSAFKDDILLRQKIRSRRAREEMKREKQINEFNERQMKKLLRRPTNIDVQSQQQFPSWGYDEFPCTSFSLELNASSPPSPPQIVPIAKNSNYKSFANILSTPDKMDFWPTLGGSSQTASPSQALESKTSCWGSPTKHSNNNVRISESSESTSDMNTEIGCIPGTSRQNLGDVIADALLNKQLENGNQIVSCASGSTKKKKNKSKKTLLFSTGMNFNGNQ